MKCGATPIKIFLFWNYWIYFLVLSTYKDPLKGWTDNFNGPVGVMIGVGLGIIHVMPCNKNIVCDNIPGDYCINACLTAIYDICKK